MAQDDRQAGVSISSIEEADYVRDRIRELTERGKKRLAIYSGETNLIENYIREEIYLGLRIVSGIFEQYGFVFKFSELMESDIPSKNRKTTYFYNSVYQPFVLTQNIHLMECPKKLVSSLVRVERFDDSAIGRREPLFAFYPIPRVYKVMERAENRKVSSMIRRYSVPARQGCSEQVKGASKCVYDGTEFSVEETGQRFHAHYGKFVSGLRILLYPDYLNIRFPGSETPLEDWELGYAPID